MRQIAIATFSFAFFFFHFQTCVRVASGPVVQSQKYDFQKYLRSDVFPIVSSERDGDRETHLRKKRVSIDG